MVALGLDVLEMGPVSGPPYPVQWTLLGAGLLTVGLLWIVLRMVWRARLQRRSRGL